MATATNVMELECSQCGKKFDAEIEQHLCTCGKPLLVRYDLKNAAATLTLEECIEARSNALALSRSAPARRASNPGRRYDPASARRAPRPIHGIATSLRKRTKPEPTGSFKARGMTAAVTRAKQLGAKILAAPTAGMRRSARCYAAAAGIPAVIVMPADTPAANVMECQAFGAKVVKLDGLISDCGGMLPSAKDREGWYDVSTLKEPYRVEGKKTMGYELWEQFEGKLPDVIFVSDRRRRWLNRNVQSV